MKRDQNGFTLVEMLVSIVVGSLVTLAATTVLLLGLRINNQSTKTVIRQNTARVVITMLENLATEGEINSVETLETDDETEDAETAEPGWHILNVDSDVLARFNKNDGAIYVGNSSEPLLDGITESQIKLSEKNVLTISVEMEDGSIYNSAIYCRTMRIPEEETNEEKGAVGKLDNPDVDFEDRDDAAARLAFLKKLTSQHRMGDGYANPGLILDGNGRSTGTYYSEWYVGGYEGKDGWNPETPWCACFISWGLNEAKAYIQQDQIPQDRVREDGDCVWFASVDQFVSYLKNSENKHQFILAQMGDSYVEPVPGDIIFIDWDGKDDEGNFDPAHVGAVLWVDKVNGVVYTIEGNSTGEIVAVKSYPIASGIIMGYGILDWVETNN